MKCKKCGGEQFEITATSTHTFEAVVKGTNITFKQIESEVYSTDSFPVVCSDCKTEVDKDELEEQGFNISFDFSQE